MELNTLTAHELIEKINKKEATSGQIADSLIKRIKDVDSKVSAYVRLPGLSDTKDETQGAKSPLKGIPVSIKDNICTQGYNTECCSRILEGFKPPYDATVIRKLKEAGAQIFPLKTNMDEFAFGSSTENSCFGPTHNPWNLECVPGGSSGGSAAAVAADEAIWALGSDTGGSIRQPASFCGVVGLKPTYGRVSRYGLIAMASSLDQIGPLAKTVEDAALMLSVMARPDDRSPISLPGDGREFLPVVERPDIRGLKVAWSPDLGVVPVDQGVRTIAGAAARRFAELGCTVEEGEPDFGNVREVIRVTRALRMVTLHAEKLKNWREKMNPNLVSNIEQGFPVTARQVGEAEMERTAIYHRVRKFFERYDLLLTPTVAVPPFPVEADYPKEINGQAMTSYTDWFLLTYAITITGLPAISVPCGWTDEGFPVGLQIVGRRLGEATVLRAAAAFEALAPWRDKRPPIAMG